MPIETRGVLAYRDPESGHLVVWSSTQNPYLVRDAVAVVLGLPAEEVRVLAPDVGGGFGPKGAVYHEELLVAGRRAPPRPARSSGSRAGASTSPPRATTASRSTGARIGFRRDGTIVAIDDAFLADVGAYPVEGTGSRSTP